MIVGVRPKLSLKLFLQYASGDRYAMSSRAITSDILRKMYHYNQAERRSDIFAGTEKSPQKSVKTWGSPRRRIFVHAVVTIAFVCLMRIDEVLNLQFEDVKSSGTNRLSITLESRKTHQYGGWSLVSIFSYSLLIQSFYRT